MTPLFYALREREAIMDVFESLTGSRLTPSFMRIGGLAADIDGDFIKAVTRGGCVCRRGSSLQTGRPVLIQAIRERSGSRICR
jgi:hypothetical protein